MSSTITTTATASRIHVDRGGAFDFNGIEFADTGMEPIAIWNRNGWDLFIFGQDGPLMLGGHLGMTDQEIQELACEAMNDD